MACIHRATRHFLFISYLLFPPKKNTNLPHFLDLGWGV
jgi:hypothetical protein